MVDSQCQLNTTTLDKLDAETQTLFRNLAFAGLGGSGAGHFPPPPAWPHHHHHFQPPPHHHQFPPHMWQPPVWPQQQQQQQQLGQHNSAQPAFQQTFASGRPSAWQ